MSNTLHRAVTAYLDALRPLRAAADSAASPPDYTPLIDALHAAGSALYPLLDDHVPPDLLDQMRAIDEDLTPGAMGTIGMSGLRTHGHRIVRELGQVQRDSRSARTGVQTHVPSTQPAGGSLREDVVNLLAVELGRLALSGKETVTWAELDDLLHPHQPTAATRAYALALVGRGLLEPMPRVAQADGRTGRVSLADRVFAGRVSRWRILPAVLAHTSHHGPGAATDPKLLEPGDGANGASTRTNPVWDSVSRVLRVGGWEKRYKGNAKNQVRVLDAFQKSGWPDRIDNPLGHESLNTTVRDMNDSLGTARPIVFEMDGTGGGIRWRVVSRTPPDLS
jgi:hypothetical protein